jgi:hypothetical protein
MTTIDQKLVEALTEAIRDALRKGKVAFHIEDLPNGLTEIQGTFDLSTIADACLAEIERAGFKLIKG